jgi:mono/diheme cytochrome c family protein
MGLDFPWKTRCAPARAEEARQPRPNCFSFLISAILLAIFAAAGCSSRTSPPSPPLTPQQQRGQRVFTAMCAACHNPRPTAPVQGPSLQGLFKKKYLTSGAPANDDRVRETIQLGRKDMPPFGNLLNDSQIDDLIAYLHSL